MKSISIVFVLFVVLSTVYIIPTTYAEDDDDDIEGFGEMKREREHQDEWIPIGTDIGNVILYGTIAAIVPYKITFPISVPIGIPSS